MVSFIQSTPRTSGTCHIIGGGSTLESPAIPFSAVEPDILGRKITLNDRTTSVTLDVYMPPPVPSPPNDGIREGASG
jgi:hypothetical protein